MRFVMTSHVIELWWRLGYVTFAWGLATAWCYMHAPLLLYLCVKPFLVVRGLAHGSFMCTHLAEALYAQMSVGVSVGCILTTPYIVYHAWAFLVPSLYAHERTLCTSLCIGLLGFFFFSFGVGYTVVVPAVWAFLQGFELDNGAFKVQAHARVSEYLVSLHTVFSSLFLALLCAAAGTLLVYILHLQPHTLGSFRKLAAVVCLLVGALVSPPDPLSQCMCAGILWLVYESCVVGASLREGYLYRLRI